MKACALALLAGPVPRSGEGPRPAAAPAHADRPRHCAICTLRESCLAHERLCYGDCGPADLVLADRRVRRGETLYRAGDALRYLYAVRGGIFKTVRNLEDGREQVTGFRMAGDLLGADAIESNLHGCDAVALEESRVCAILYSGVERIGRALPGMHDQLRRAMSGELVRQQDVIVLLGTMSAEERVAMFLVALSRRYKDNGYSPTEFTLRMTRLEIGSYLGIKIETVSRMFSKLRSVGLIHARREQIRILDIAGLMRCAGRDVHGTAVAVLRPVSCATPP